MNYEFKGTSGKWYLQEFTDTYTNIVRSNNRKYQETLMVLYTPQGGGKEARYNALLASKAPEMFEMLKSVSQGINSMSFDQLELLNDDIEQLLKEATEL